MKTNRIYPEVVVFNNLIAALGRKGKVKEAFKLFNDVSDAHHFKHAISVGYNGVYGTCLYYQSVQLRQSHCDWVSAVVNIVKT